MPTFGSLFAGIGGLDLGLERAGWTCRWQVERDPFCNRVLAQHWPDVTRYGDIHALDLERVERVDLVCGGFPCQPVSVAGKRLAQADARWLWPEFSRIIRALRPRLVLVENVPGLLVRGFGDVVGDLAASGYDAEWDCLGANDVGAPHRRDRVWLVAHTADGLRRENGRGVERGEAPGGREACRWEVRPRHGSAGDDGSSAGGADVADARLECSRAEKKSGGADTPIRSQSPVQPSGCGQAMADATSNGWQQGRSDAGQDVRIFGGGGLDRFTDWDVEPDVGRVAHGVPARVDRLRGLGNAVVPQVAEWIGRRLMDTLDRARA